MTSGIHQHFPRGQAQIISSFWMLHLQCPTDPVSSVPCSNKNARWVLRSEEFSNLHKFAVNFFSAWRMEDEPNLALSKLVIPLILAFTEPRCRLQISVKSLERKEHFLQLNNSPSSDIFRAEGRRKYLIYFSNDIEPNHRIAIVQ